MYNDITVAFLPVHEFYYICNTAEFCVMCTAGMQLSSFPSFTEFHWLIVP